MEQNFKKKAMTQYFASISANVLIFGFGCGLAWLSMALPLLQSDHSPLETGPLTVEEVSWIGSVMSIGALIGNIAIGYIVLFIGSRNSILMIGFPQLAGWLLMIFGTNAWHLGYSRFLSGFVVGGAQVCTSLYTAEISDNEIRGRLSTIYQYSRSFGILFAYVIGSYFNYIIASMFFSAITILFIVSFMFVPSTPQYFLQKNRPEMAENSFKFYNKHKFELEKEYTVEFENMKIVAKQIQQESKITLRDIGQARLAIFQAIIFAALACLSGQMVFLTYGSSTIEKAGTHLSLEMSSICMAIFQIVATFVSFLLIDRKGRRLLMVISLLGCAIGNAIMIAYLYLHNAGIDTTMYHWTPIICMSSVVFSSSIGVTPLTLVCLAESFPTKIRSFGLTFGTVVMNIVAFVISKCYPIWIDKIDLQGCLVIFCVSCIIGTIFTLLFVEETNGKDLNTIAEGNSSRKLSVISI